MNENKRNCPQCNKELIYKSKKASKAAERKKSLCIKCRSILIHSNPNWRSQISKANSNKPKTEEHKQKLRLANIGKTYSDEVNKKKGRNGQLNSNYQTSNYSRWLKKYGKEEADRRNTEWKNKESICSKGSNNPMYGKPSPQGSGNGWSGWYKGYFFRSLLELAYLKYLIDNKIEFETGEQKHIVEYNFLNLKRTYRADFYLIESQELIEVKPKKLINTPNNKAKFEAAKKIYGDKFKIITEEQINKLTTQQLVSLVNYGELKWMKRYEEKFNEYINENN